MKRLVRGVDFGRARTLVELGVGDGCVTRELLRRMHPDARLVSLEINPAFVEACRALDDPRLTLVEACATQLPEVLKREGLGEVDAVVSSLPLSIMDPSAVEAILDVSRSVLRQGGRFLQYQYSLAHHQSLCRRYGAVEVDFTLFNIPPAYVYVCSIPEERAAPKRRLRRRWSLAGAYAAMLAWVAMAVRAVQQL